MESKFNVNEKVLIQTPMMKKAFMGIIQEIVFEGQTNTPIYRVWVPNRGVKIVGEEFIFKYK